MGQGSQGLCQSVSYTYTLLIDFINVIGHGEMHRLERVLSKIWRKKDKKWHRRGKR